MSNDLGTGHSDESKHVSVPVDCLFFRMEPPVDRRWMFEIFEGTFGQLFAQTIDPVAYQDHQATFN